MPNFKNDFELRRVIFGLTAILRTPPQNLPQVVLERIPELTRQLALLSIKMKEERLEILRDNEEHIAKESKPKGKDDEGEEGMEDAEEEDSDNEFDSTLEKI